MLRLIRKRGQERGGIAVLVAIVFATLVISGVAALVVDVGSLYAERRVVQNGADAASLALAQSCANGLSVCSLSAATDLQTLAGLNAGDDGKTALQTQAEGPGICGSVAPFISCPIPPASPNLAECTKLPPSLPATVKWVEVRTKTLSTGSNPSVVPKFFANLFTSSYDGKGVKACSRTAWGPAGGIKTPAPVAFSMCEWNSATGTGVTYGNKPPFTPTNPATPGLEVALAFNAPNNAACATWAGHDLPGGFGWLCHDGSCTPPAPVACSIAVDGSAWVDTVTGIGGGNDCKNEMNGLVGTVAYLPIFDCMSKTKTFCDNTSGGTHSYYHIKGYGAFYVTGVDVAGGMDKNFLPGYPTPAASATCTAKGGKCMYGWFLKDFVPGTAVIGDDSSLFGLTVIQVVG